MTPSQKKLFLEINDQWLQNLGVIVGDQIQTVAQMLVGVDDQGCKDVLLDLQELQKFILDLID